MKSFTALEGCFLDLDFFFCAGKPDIWSTWGSWSPKCLTRESDQATFSERKRELESVVERNLAALLAHLFMETSMTLIGNLNRVENAMYFSSYNFEAINHKIISNQ